VSFNALPNSGYGSASQPAASQGRLDVGQGAGGRSCDVWVVWLAASSLLRCRSSVPAQWQARPGVLRGVSVVVS
jgi:hypothetical protein